jgi:hypothetical protein
MLAGNTLNKKNKETPKAAVIGYLWVINKSLYLSHGLVINLDSVLNILKLYFGLQGWGWNETTLRQ